MNRDEEIMASLKQQGLEFPTLGEMISEAPTPDAPRCTPPRLEGQPEFPPPGIYFGMSDEDYHSIPACSTSALKKLAVSSMDCWAESKMNPDRIEKTTDYLDYGKAIHAFVLEGEEAYLSRYAVGLEMADFEGQNVIVSTEQVKAAIGQFMELAPVKPVGTKKQDLLDQLIELHEANDDGAPLPLDRDADAAGLRAQIASFMKPQPVKPISKITDTMEDGTEYQRAAVKADWIAQLQRLNPETLVWDVMVEAHRQANEGKDIIGAISDRRIRIASKMILAHDEIAQAVKGGWPEVSVFWYCPKTGAPMKARFDYLKMRMLVDLKSFGNNAGMPIDRAIERTIANYRYNLQHVIYEDAAMQARAMIAAEMDGGTPPIFIDERLKDRFDDIVAFCLKWATQSETPAFLFIFQQSGNAPVTRGKLMPRGTVFSVTRSRAEELKRKWVHCATVFGTDPWLDIQPIDEIEDEMIPLFATEL